MSDGTPNTDVVDTGDGGNEKKGFTVEEQKQIDDLINGAYSKAYAKATTKISAESKVEIDTLKEQIAELKVDKGNKDDKGQHADLTALKETVDSLTKERDQAKVLASSATLKAIASELDAVSSDQVATLVAPFIRQDGNKTLILNSDGDIKFNSKGDEMTVREFIKEFLSENSHLVKAAKGKGSGSESAKGKSGSASDMAALKKMSPTERITQARKQGIK